MGQYKFNWSDFTIFLILNIIVAITMDLALFSQTTSGMKDASFFKKVLSAEFWATIEWMALIPANIIGNRILTAPQLNLSSFVFDFLGQIGTNKFWLKIPTTIDDYTAMIIIIIGMGVSGYKLFG
jgi:uncharacterized protein (DUF486 family)